MNLFTQQKQNHGYRKQTYGYQGIRGEGINWEIGTDLYTLLYIKQISIDKDLLYSTGNSTQWSVLAYMEKESYKKKQGGFPGGAVVENLPANAGDTGSGPGLGRSHMPRSSQAREPQLLSLCVWSLCSATREAAIVRGPHTAMKSDPRLPQLEKALAQKRRPNTAKNK